MCASSTRSEPNPDCGHLRVMPDKDVDQIGPCGAAALAYVRTFGLPVLRIRPGSAEPNVHRGVHSATTDEHEIRRLFSSGPESNLAARTGRGWLVVDLDRKNGVDGAAELLQFMQDRGVSLPPVPWATTPSGGRHLWLRTAGEVPSRSSSSRFLPGVDVLADGGHYALLPPSAKLIKVVRRPGDPKENARVPVPYQWAAGSCPCQAPLAPQWLLEAIHTLPSLTEDLIKTGLTPGSRNHDAYRVAVRLWRQHGQGGGAAVVAVCRQIWSATPQHPEPFGWDEMQGRIASARRWVQQQETAERRANGGFLRYLEQGRVA